MKKHIFFAAMCCMISMSLSAESGTCGDNLTWTLDDNGTLTISGTGAMSNYYSRMSSPWYDNRLSIKNVFIGSGATSVGECAFADCTNLIAVSLPNSIRSIGRYAFLSCEALSDINMPTDIESIGAAAFYDSKLYNDKGNWQDGALYIGNCFIKADTLSMAENYTIKDGTNLIADHAFPVYPDSVYYYSGNGTAFNEVICDFLDIIEDWHLGGWERYQNSKIQNITIPNSVRYIGNLAFANCTALQSIHWGTGIRQVGYMSTAYCTNLKKYYIEDLTAWCSINWNMDRFEYYNPLLSLYVNNDLVKDLTIPTNVEIIKMGAFFYNTDLRSVKISEGVKQISDRVFLACTKLDSIDISSSVQAVGSYAFAICDSLKLIKCRALTPPDVYENGSELVNEEVDFFSPYEDKYEKVLLYVPRESLSLYKSHNIWGKFSKIEAINDVPTSHSTFINPHSTPLTVPCKVFEQGEVRILMPDGRRFNLQGTEVQ